MPKLKRTSKELANAMLVGTIRKYMILHEIDMAETSVACGLGQSSMYNRLNDPETFQVKEIRALIKKLHIPIDEILQGLIIP